MFSIFLFSASRGDAASRVVLLPDKTELSGAHVTQHLLLESVVDGRFTAEKTAAAKFTSANAKIATVDEEGVVHPAANGETTITATVNGQSATAEIKVTGIGHDAPRSFRNEVQPVLAKMGCSMGACHGALAGKGGFKLSLRGYDADADYWAMTRQALGRRVDKLEPARSLVLLKPTRAVRHAGGKKLEAGGPDYRVLAEWIAAGAP